MNLKTALISIGLIALLFGTIFYLLTSMTPDPTPAVPTEELLADIREPLVEVPKGPEAPTDPFYNPEKTACEALEPEAMNLIMQWNQIVRLEGPELIDKLNAFSQAHGFPFVADQPDSLLSFLYDEGPCGNTYMTFIKNLTNYGSIFFELDEKNEVIKKWYYPMSGAFLTDFQGEELRGFVRIRPFCEVCTETESETGDCFQPKKVAVKFLPEGFFVIAPDDNKEPFEWPAPEACQVPGVKSAYGQCSEFTDSLNQNKRRIYTEAECT